MPNLTNIELKIWSKIGKNIPASSTLERLFLAFILETLSPLLIKKNNSYDCVFVNCLSEVCCILPRGAWSGMAW